MKNVEIRIKTTKEWNKFDTEENKRLYNACEHTEEDFECVVVDELPVIGETVEINNWKDGGYTFVCEVHTIVRAYEAYNCDSAKEVFKVFVEPVKIEDANNEVVYTR